MRIKIIAALLAGMFLCMSSGPNTYTAARAEEITTAGGDGADTETTEGLERDAEPGENAGFEENAESVENAEITAESETDVEKAPVYHEIQIPRQRKMLKSASGGLKTYTQTRAYSTFGLSYMFDQWYALADLRRSNTLWGGSTNGYLYYHLLDAKIPSFCLELQTAAGGTYTADDASELLTKLCINSPDRYRGLSRAMYLALGYADEAEGQRSHDILSAAQWFFWSMLSVSENDSDCVVPCVDADGTLINDRWLYSMDLGNDDAFRSDYETIRHRLLYYETLPDFLHADAEAAVAAPVEMAWNEAKNRYEVQLLDESGMLSAADRHSLADERIAIAACGGIEELSALQGTVMAGDESIGYERSDTQITFFCSEALNTPADLKLKKHYSGESPDAGCHFYASDDPYWYGGHAYDSQILGAQPWADAVYGYLRLQTEKTTGDLLIIKCDAGDRRPLKGAKVCLEKQEGTEWVKTGEDRISDAEGKILFSELAAGTYRITELSAPAGYMLLAEPVELELDFDGAGTEDASLQTVYLADQAVFQIPLTGGNGAWMAFSLLLMELAAMFFYFRNRKCSKNDFIQRKV